MPLQLKQEKKIMTILRELPEEKVNELMDFAEYLKNKTVPTRTERKKTHGKLPVFHLGRIEPSALDREGLYGEHLDRKLA